MIDVGDDIGYLGQIMFIRTNDYEMDLYVTLLVWIRKCMERGTELKKKHRRSRRDKE